MLEESGGYIRIPAAKILLGQILNARAADPLRDIDGRHDHRCDPTTGPRPVAAQVKVATGPSIRGRRAPNCSGDISHPSIAPCKFNVNRQEVNADALCRVTTRVITPGISASSRASRSSSISCLWTSPIRDPFVVDL